jgi:RecB family exonuclease
MATLLPPSPAIHFDVTTELVTTEPKRAKYSVSALMAYERCPFEYYYTAVLKLPPPRTMAMARGVSLHKLIADHLRGKLVQEPAEGTDVAAMFELFRQSRFNVPSLAVEKSFSIALAEGDLRGRIDLVLPRGDGIELVDFKSGHVVAREDLARRLQLPVYALAASTLFHAAEPVAYTYYFPRNGTEESFTASPDFLAETRERVHGLMLSIRAKRFAPAPDCTCFACRSTIRRVVTARRGFLEHRLQT